MQTQRFYSRSYGTDRVAFVVGLGVLSAGDAQRTLPLLEGGTRLSERAVTDGHGLVTSGHELLANPVGSFGIRDQHQLLHVALSCQINESLDVSSRSSFSLVLIWLPNRSSRRGVAGRWVWCQRCSVAGFAEGGVSLSTDRNLWLRWRCHPSRWYPDDATWNNHPTSSVISKKWRGVKPTSAGIPPPTPPPPQRPDKGQLRISENLRETYENLQQPWRIPGHGYGCPGMDKNLRNHVKFQSDPIWIPVTLKRILKTPRTNAEREGCGVWNSLISQ